MIDLSDTPPSEPQAVKLDDCYDVCLAGATLGLEADRFVYSISKLIRFERARLKVSTEDARVALAGTVTAIQREHGILAPVFLNDELIEPVVDGDELTGPKIIQPGDAGFIRPRLPR